MKSSLVNVVSVQHSGDPVHHIDTIMTLGVAGYAPQQDNWTTIQATSPGASEGVHGIHNAAYYSATLAANIDRVPPETQAEMSRFFVGDENTYGTQQTYYGWSE